MHRLPRGQALDRLLAIVCVLWAQVDVWLVGTTPGSKWLIAPLTLAGTAVLAVRRRWPLAAGAVAALTGSLMTLGGGHANSIPLAISYICCLYGLAVWTSTAAFLAGCAIELASDVLTALAPHGSVHDAGPWAIITLLVMVIVRRVVRERQLAADAHAARAALLERERDLRAQEAVAEERARIARELHDLVAHNVSVMVVQAGAERLAIATAQPATAEVLAAIEQAGRQALAEARRLLGVLRADGGAAEILHPQPGVGELDGLVEQVERAGLPVTLAVEGERVALPAGVELCAYRIVQEGLTNALRHAGPARAEIVLRYVPDGVDVVVRDDGRGAANGDGGGHGLIGMRERVAMYGGTLYAGPRDGGGFEVCAHLPVS